MRRTYDLKALIILIVLKICLRTDLDRYKNIILPRSHVCFELEYYSEAYQDANKALGKYISCTT